jgi:hypothetical protein
VIYEDTGSALNLSDMDLMRHVLTELKYIVSRISSKIVYACMFIVSVTGYHYVVLSDWTTVISSLSIHSDSRSVRTSVTIGPI